MCQPGSGLHRAEPSVTRTVGESTGCGEAGAALSPPSAPEAGCGPVMAATSGQWTPSPAAGGGVFCRLASLLLCIYLL